MNDSRRSSASRLPWRLASDSRATHCVAVANCTRWPARHARIDSATARWVLPVPGGPSRITFSRACRKSSWPRCSTTVFFTLRWKVKSNSSSVLREREAGGLDPALAAVAVARGHLGRQQYLGETFIAPGLLAGALGERRQRARRGRGLQ